MSNLSWDLIKSDHPRAGRLDRRDVCEADSPAWRMGKGKPVYVNYPRRRPALRYEFDPPTPSQMFARLGLLLVIALGFALVAEFLV